MFNNSKYGNILTVILIIAIIGIIGIISFIGYRIYKSRYVDTGAVQAATEFENNVDNNNNNQNKIDISEGVENTFSDKNLSTKKRTKYKGYYVVGTIEIPTINLKYPILEKVTKKSLETAVALLYTSNGLNEQGNSVIIGHNYRNGTMFSNVKKLEKGKAIYITDTQGRKVKYVIYNIYRTSGNDGNYIARNTNGKREISLSTCTDDSKARTIVLAKEE